VSAKQKFQSGKHGGEVACKGEDKSPPKSLANGREVDGGLQLVDSVPNGIIQPICKVCGKACKGYYGRWGDSGTCTSECEKEEIKRQRSKRVQ
jgi:hypothetical protein